MTLEHELTISKRYNHDFGEYHPLTGIKMLSAPQISGLTGSTLAAACVAAAFAGNIGTRLGRKFGLVLAAITYIIGIAISCGATTYSVVIVSKVFTGLGIGFAANFVIPYWAETAPVMMRGLVIVMYQAIINIAQFVGACIVRGTNTLTTRWAYRGPLLTELLPPFVLLACVYWLPETPSKLSSSCRKEEIYATFIDLMS